MAEVFIRTVIFVFQFYLVVFVNSSVIIEALLEFSQVG